jgi:signal transduction histidine kinase
MAATAAAVEGYAIAGVDPENPGGIVAAVSPTGFAWRDGIRPGQLVVALEDSTAPGGWRLETRDAAGLHTSREQPIDDALRASLPLALLALLVGGCAVLFTRTHRRWVAPVAAIGFALAGIPLWLQGVPEISTAAMAGAGFLPFWLFAERAPPRWRFVGRAAVGVTAVGWIACRLGASPSYDALESFRGVGAGYGTAAVIALATVPRLLRGEGFHLIRPRLADLLAVSLVGGVALILMFSVHLSAAAVFIAIALALVAVPTTRFIGRRLERVFLADLRAQVELEASEAERARLARDLHDVPLQELTSVIRHLEVVPEARESADRLRAVAQQLRETATELRPPVLDDLGLGAALDFLASQSSDDGVVVMSVVADTSGPHLEHRPPADVELAVFRIAQEAVTNAIQHAAATAIDISGDVQHDAVSITVHDDGRGLTHDRQHEAAQVGRLGLASMRRRAEAIDADLAVSGSSSGTRVSIRWAR